MRKLRSHEWVGVGVVLIVVGFLVVEGVFGNLIQPQSPVALPSNNLAMQDTGNTQDLTIETLSQGTGAEVKALDEVTVHYVGTLTDGTQFDSSVDRGTPFTFVIGQGQVIEGWEEGILGMKVGEKRRLTILPSKAYGAAPGHRLQNETLIFEVELLGIE